MLIPGLLDTLRNRSSRELALSPARHKSLQNRARRRQAREIGGERIEIAPPVPGFYQVHAVPLKSLFDRQFGAQPLVEGASGLVSGDDPDDQPAGAESALREGDFRHQPAADARALEFTADVDRG